MSRGGARKDPRIDVRLSAEVRYQGKVFTATTRNLSIGGVCLESPVPLDEGADVTVGLFLVEEDVESATGAPLELRSKVAWSAPGEEGSPNLFGVRFESLTAVQMGGLTKFMNTIGQS